MLERKTAVKSVVTITTLPAANPLFHLFHLFSIEKKIPTEILCDIYENVSNICCCRLYILNDFFILPLFDNKMFRMDMSDEEEEDEEDSEEMEDDDIQKEKKERGKVKDLEVNEDEIQEEVKGNNKTPPYIKVR